MSARGTDCLAKAEDGVNSIYQDGKSWQRQACHIGTLDMQNAATPLFTIEQSSGCWEADGKDAVFEHRNVTLEGQTTGTTIATTTAPIHRLSTSDSCRISTSPLPDFPAPRSQMRVPGLASTQSANERFRRTVWVTIMREGSAMPSWHRRTCFATDLSLPSSSSSWRMSAADDQRSTACFAIAQQGLAIP
ncbi:hypothetical protein CC79DRAFT_548502 [Sarocladium strictum]